MQHSLSGAAASLHKDLGWIGITIQSTLCARQGVSQMCLLRSQLGWSEDACQTMEAESSLCTVCVGWGQCGELGQAEGGGSEGGKAG